ncbi:MAG: hypothetical protein RMK15_11295, partial [Chloroflexota bacterium]|nr:hypothetical protein [Chloroflexota bacterium]
MDTAQAPRLPLARVARVAVPIFLLLAIVALAFGLGYLVHDLRSEDTAKSPAASSAALQNDPVGAALLDEIYEVLRQNHIDGDLLTPEAVRQAAIEGVLRLLNDPHTAYLTPADVAAGALDLSSTYQGI